MEDTGRWIVCGLVGLVGILGLFLAAGAVDGGFYFFGLLLFAFAVVFVFANVKNAFDEAESTAAAGDEQTV